MFKLVKSKKHQISLKNHFERRNKVLIKRRIGGFGDILMQRMMFEDFKNQFPNLQIDYTCPYLYLEMANNNPYVKTINIEFIDESQYGMIYDISTACRVHESREGGKNTKHRSDIWANHCGLELTKHEMHLTPIKEKLENAKKYLELKNKENKSIVLLTTKSADECKDLPVEATEDLIKHLQKDFFVITIHNEQQVIHDKLGTLQFINIKIQDWIALVDSADYVISVDSATFHLAGGLKKPLVGIFAHTDGKVYGKYYDFILIQKHRDNGDWDCGPCFNKHQCIKSTEKIKPCIKEIKVSEIIKGFNELLNK